MNVNEVLRLAIGEKRCVRLRVAGKERRVCPHALGLKDGHPRVLAFQYAGASSSGLAPGGHWRAFFVHEIEQASFIDGPWCTGGNLVAKLEAMLDHVEYQVK
ncbi:MAG TPA: hypothetical protein VLX85_07310 [Stellaceae bacterium]|nr:hypothetical protein [Stellaceae bacterium]